MSEAEELLPDGQCKCDWIYADASSPRLCGCGEHHCRIWRDRIIHWHGSHWLIECAFEAAKKEIGRLRHLFGAYKELEEE